MRPSGLRAPPVPLFWVWHPLSQLSHNFWSFGGDGPVGWWVWARDGEGAAFWLKLLDQIDEEEDRLVAYKIDARSAKGTLTAGTMVCSEKVVCFLV